jgi:hypothetical protein
MAAIVLDLTLFPVVFSSLPPQFADHDVDRYFDAFRELHEREEPFLHISDLRHAAAMSSSTMRKKAALFMEDERERSERLCRGSVQIADSAITRGAMTAIWWLSPPPYPHATAASLEEAVQWIGKKADEEGFVVDADALLKLGQQLMAA